MGHNRQGFLMALGEHELRFVLSHDFRLVEREFVVMLVVDMGWRKEVMSVWSKRGRGRRPRHYPQE